jgi:hypothetical protein
MQASAQITHSCAKDGIPLCRPSRPERRISRVARRGAVTRGNEASLRPGPAPSSATTTSSAAPMAASPWREEGVHRRWREPVPWRSGVVGDLRKITRAQQSASGPPCPNALFIRSTRYRSSPRQILRDGRGPAVVAERDRNSSPPSSLSPNTSAERSRWIAVARRADHRFSRAATCGLRLAMFSCWAGSAGRGWTIVA